MTRMWLSTAIILSGFLFLSSAFAQSVEPQAHIYRIVDNDTLRAYVFAPAPAAEDGVSGNAAPDRTARAAPNSIAPNSIALFHGGGWNAGSPEWTYPAARRFAGAGLVAISVQYRLVDDQITPADAFQDVCAFFGWLRSHKDELEVSNRVAGYGVSAGGHLVAATVTVGCPRAEHDLTPLLPEALLLWSPALDLTRDGWFIGLMKGRDAALMLSPANHVGPLTPPTSIVIGERDTLTPLRGAQAFCRDVLSRDQTCEVHTYKGLGHLLTRNLTNQESDFDPDPIAVADGRARHIRFLKSQGFIETN